MLIRTVIAAALLPMVLTMFVGSAAAGAEPATQPVPSPTRVAIVGASPVVLLAQATLSSEPNIRLVERDEVRKVLGEQELALSLGGNTAEAVRAGKLVSADVLAVAQTTEPNGPPVALVVFDVATGVRLWDAALTQQGAEQEADEISSAVKASLAKRRAISSGQGPGGARTLCVLTVRNADLPRGMDGLCQAVGQLVERELVASAGIAVVERSRLDQVTQERRLSTGGAEAANELLPSLIVAEIEVSRNTPAGLRATVVLTGSGHEPIGKPSAAVDDVDPGRLSSELVEGVLKTLGAPNARAATRPADGGQSYSVMSRKAEAARFCREARLRWSHNEEADALRDAEAAHALEPEDLQYHAAVARGIMLLAAHIIYKGVHPEAQQYFIHSAITDEQINESLDIALAAQDSMIEAAEHTSSDGGRVPADLVTARQAMKVYADAFGPLVTNGKPIARSDQLPPVLKEKFRQFVARMPVCSGAGAALGSIGPPGPGGIPAPVRLKGPAKTPTNPQAPTTAPATRSTVRWSRARLLADTFDDTESFHYLCNPVIFEGSLHVITYVRDDSSQGQSVARAMRIDLSNGNRALLARAPDIVRRDDRPRVPFTPAEKLSHVPLFGNYACAGDGYYAVCDNKEGVFLFPLDGGSVRRVTAADGLPCNHFSAITILEGKLYLGMGFEGSDGYLMSYDLKTRSIETLASSRRKDVRSPFDDGPPMFIPCMISDARRHRIVFLAYGADMEPRRQGLYQFTPADGKFRQLLEVPLHHRLSDHTDVAGNILARASPLYGDRVVFNIRYRPAVFDLATDKLSAPVATPSSANRPGSPAAAPDGDSGALADSWDKTDPQPRPGQLNFIAHPPFALAGGWLWFSFGRASANSNLREDFACLRPEITQVWFWPKFMQYLPDSRQMVLSDGYGAWVLDDIEP